MLDFLIFYEHVNREIENDTLLKNELQKRGYSCEIVRFTGPGIYRLHKKKNRARVVVTPWLRYNENVYKYLQYAKKPYKIVNLQWEQVYSLGGVKSGITVISGEAMKAYHTCWGENSRARLENSGIPAENLQIVGAMQQDYGRPLFDKYYLDKEGLAEKYSLRGDVEWILFISSFSYATYPEADLKKLAERFGDHILENAKLHKTSQAAMLDWIEVLLERTDKEFIYRPHPSELLCERLEEIKKKYPNFHVISERSVKQWAKVSDKVNLWISTSNAEIASMGVDYHIIRPLPINEDFDAESMVNEETITELEEFIRINISDVSVDPEKIAERLENLSHYYNYDFERAAYERTADDLEKVYKSEKGQEFVFSDEEKKKFSDREARIRFSSWLMEHKLKHPKSKYIERFPKGDKYKKSLYDHLKIHENAIKTEKRMMEYLKNHE
jgi:surface carbohydrate biosynthesis protein